MKRKIIRRGEIYCADLYGSGSEQKGKKFVIIYSNNANNKHAPIVNVIPLTSKMKDLCVHVLIKDCGLELESMALVEQITTIDKKNLLYKAGNLSSAYLKKIDDACDIQFGRKMYTPMEDPFLAS